MSGTVSAALASGDTGADEGIDTAVDRQLLLVLDNCEHVVDACASIVSDLLARAPDLRVLSTSQRALGVEGEQVWPLEPLDVPPAQAAADPDSMLEFDAVRLFVEHARSALPDFEITIENAGAVQEIVQRLDGLPLAIALARARACACSGLSTSRRALDDRFRLLIVALAPADKRHQTLRACDRMELRAARCARAGGASPALRVRRAIRTRRGDRHRSRRRRGRHSRRLVRFGRPILGVGRTRAGHDALPTPRDDPGLRRESDYSAPFSRDKPANGTASGTCTSWKRPRHIFEARMPTSG